ncbi:MAG: hypothetical protein ACJ8C4_14255 [Gemmataceae bacterium]
MAQLFVSSAADLEVLDTSGFLRYSASLHGGGRATSGPTESLALPPAPADEMLGSSPQPNRGIAVVRTSKADVNTWAYTEAGGTVLLETPNPLSKALWLRLTRYVELLDPGEDPNGP